MTVGIIAQTLPLVATRTKFQRMLAAFEGEVPEGYDEVGERLRCFNKISCFEWCAHPRPKFRSIWWPLF